MLHVILAFLLSPFHHNAAAVAQVQTCVWPHVCAQQADALAANQVQTCVWPHVCKQQPLPNKCG